ncbi:MAG TPA: MFS transporter [Acidimicrobiales bacterium]|nr:MFS transporter [Acidimicrobiales bacterium]
MTDIRETESTTQPKVDATRPDVVTSAVALASTARTVSQLMDEAPMSRFHRRAVLISGMGFFTDAYDLFVIGTVAAILKLQWNLSTTQTSWVTGAAILGAFVGAFVFGRVADVLGRKSVYITVAVIMVIGALASAFAPNLIFLVVARFVLGLGIGGDYPVSAVMMSEFSNRRDRGRLVGLVFSMQAVGLIVGPLVGLVLLSSGMSSSLTWRVMLGLGALPAAAVIYFRSRMPESPRFQSRVLGRSEQAATDLQVFANGAVDTSSAVKVEARLMRLREFLVDPRMILLMLGTAGSWFLFDYAYYGNTLSLPSILNEVSPNASLELKLVLTLALFVAFAVPGYLLAVWKMDKIGHRRLQFIGFAVMALCFLALAAVPALTTNVAPFIAIFGVSYLFTEFGPNTTTFVLPSEVFPINMRTTGHGFAAGIGKLGAFAGVFLVPQLQTHFGLRGLLLVAGVAAILGFALTKVLPEPSGRSLEDVSGEEAANNQDDVQDVESSERADVA